MNVLSLFDGCSCGQLALQRAGIKVDNYYASEIDKYAIQVTMKNFPNTIQLGDVRNVKASALSKIDLLIGGSPCQGFSSSGKMFNFGDPRSALFFEYVRILKELREINPDIKFLLENVKMKKEWVAVISEILGVEAIEINSALVSAQNRKRLYWANFPISQPKDRGIFLPDILEHGVVDRDKSYCIDASYWKGTHVEHYISFGRRQIVFTERRTEEAKRIRKEYMQKFGRDFFPRRSKELVPREDGKTNCLTATYSLKEHTLIDEKLFYRKLTPIECERLQTMPDRFTEGVSNSQRYKMIGNGWTIEVIKEIFQNLLTNPG